MAQSHAKSKNVSRSIGHTRASNDYTNGRLPLPQVQVSKTDYISEGMIVSSMAVPPQKVTNGSARKPSLVGETKAKSGDSPDSANRKSTEEWERLLKDKDKIIKEKEKEIKDKNSIIKTKGQDISNLASGNECMQKRIAALEQECALLQKKVSVKEKAIGELQSLINSKKEETDYKALYEREVIKHQETTDRLSVSDNRLTEKKKELSAAEKSYIEKMSSLQTKMEKKIAAMLLEKNCQLQEKEDRIQKMKKQMADAFTGSSVERQQQIDELSKELTKMQAECDGLRVKLRQGGHTSHSSSCENCKNLKAHLEKKEQTIKEKNRTVDELSLVCGRYETQLKQQEELLKQWQDVKGRMLIFDK